MRFTLIAFGTRGDVTPMVALGGRLAARGETVRLVTHAEFAPLAGAAGLAFTPVPGSYQAYVGTSAGRRSLGVPTNSPLGCLGLYGPFRDCAGDVFDRCWEATADADAVVGSGLATPLAGLVAARRRRPLLLAMVVPTIATRNFASPTMPQVRLGRVYHRLTFVAARKLAARGARSVFREWEEHAARLGGAAPGASVVGALVAVSPVLLPRPTDWPDVVHLTGFWFPPATPHAVSAPLRAFVDGGPPPLVFGFGSMRDDDPRGLQAVVREAVRRLGMRAVFVGGSGDALSAPADDDAVFSVPFADYSWLFPRAAAIVHQGGVGTASYALAAGVPQVTVPYCLDHTFWAARLREAGVAPNGILRSRISAPGLVRAITTVLDQPRFRDAASRCAARVRQENGLDAAEQLVYRQFGFTRPSLSPA